MSAAGIGSNRGARFCSRFIAISWTLENPINAKLLLA
jgi:hypothetical protein